MTDSAPINPEIRELAVQPYVGMRESVTVETFGTINARIPELFAWLAEREIIPRGAPFYRYNVINGPNLEVELGIPVTGDDQAVAGTDTGAVGDGTVFARELPGGRYGYVEHHGHPDAIFGVTKELLEWADREDHSWDMTPSADGERWACRLEIFQTNPEDVPDPNEWQTDLAFRLAD